MSHISNVNNKILSIYSSPSIINRIALMRASAASLGALLSGVTLRTIKAGIGSGLLTSDAVCGIILYVGTPDQETMKKLARYRISLVREGSVSYEPVSGPEDLYSILTNHLADADRENLVVVTLDARGRPIGVTTASVGTLTSSLVNAREVFKTAILQNAASIVVAHNHPSGDPTPSEEDWACTRRLVEAGRLLDIPVHDHIIVGEGRCHSMLTQSPGAF